MIWFTCLNLFCIVGPKKQVTLVRIRRTGLTRSLLEFSWNTVWNRRDCTVLQCCVNGDALCDHLVDVWWMMMICGRHKVTTINYMCCCIKQTNGRRQHIILPSQDVSLPNKKRQFYDFGCFDGVWQDHSVAERIDVSTSQAMTSFQKNRSMWTKLKWPSRCN